LRSKADQQGGGGLSSNPPLSLKASMEKVSDTSIEALIRRLRLHQAPPSPYSGDPSTAATPAAANLFQPRRAAVLVCLFHDAAGELSVSSSPSALPHSPPTPVSSSLASSWQLLIDPNRGAPVKKFRGMSVYAQVGVQGLKHPTFRFQVRFYGP
uniref:Uncharacterized protein n=2 Tax=Aegilops tauschii subsp. strangulata TaxID=200361 RepID=A0A453SE74_AEGTS